MKEIFMIIIRTSWLIWAFYSVYKFASSNRSFQERVYAGIELIVALIFYFNI